MRLYDPLETYDENPPGSYKSASGILRFENARCSGFERGKAKVPDDYRRELHLRTGVVAAYYTWEKVHYERKVFASTADEVVCANFTADADFQFSISPQRGDHEEWDRKLNSCYGYLTHIDGGLVINSMMGGKGAVEFAMSVKVSLKAKALSKSPASISLLQ